MAIRTVDFTTLPDRMTFDKSSDEDLAYAQSFWRSLHLFPPMESRLVSSDIKQRLKKAPQGSQSANVSSRSDPQPSLELREFLSRAKTLERIEEYEHLRSLALARQDDREMLHQRRRERMKREEMSRRVRSDKRSSQEGTHTPTITSDDDLVPGPEDVKLLMQEIDEFDRLKNADAADSD